MSQDLVEKDCDISKECHTKKGWGIAGFPIDVKPDKQRVKFNKAGIEVGVLNTPNANILCDGYLDFNELINLLGYLGTVATILTKAVDGINEVTRGTPKIGLQAGIEISATFHLCLGEGSLSAFNEANFYGVGFVEGGIGLSQSKSENHGAS